MHTIDFDSRAPRRFDPNRFNESTARHGYLAVGVPGILAGVDLALREYGTKPFKTLAEHALALAENGIIVTPRLARSFDQLLRNLDTASRQAYFPHGVPAEGTTWVQADLEAPDSPTRRGRDREFLQRRHCRHDSRQVQAGGGVLAAEDFQDFRATVVEPARIDYRGCEIFTPPLPSGGLTSLSILKTLEQFDLSQLAPWAQSTSSCSPARRIWPGESGSSTSAIRIS